MQFKFRADILVNKNKIYLFFLNKFRNKIVHYKDYNSLEMDYSDLSNANEATRKYYTNEAILAYNKATFIYASYSKDEQ